MIADLSTSAPGIRLSLPVWVSVVIAVTPCPVYAEKPILRVTSLSPVVEPEVPGSVPSRSTAQASAPVQAEAPAVPDEVLRQLEPRAAAPEMIAAGPEPGPSPLDGQVLMIIGGAVSVVGLVTLAGGAALRATSKRSSPDPEDDCGEPCAAIDFGGKSKPDGTGLLVLGTVAMVASAVMLGLGIKRFRQARSTRGRIAIGASMTGFMVTF